MPPVPVLRVVPLERIRRHEEIDPFRVERLVKRIEAEGIQVNPMVCTEAESGELVLLDGATRTAAFQSLGLEVAVVQLVEPEAVNLETWHHVVRRSTKSELLTQIERNTELSLVDEEDPPRIYWHDERYQTVVGSGLSPNATLSALVDTYVGRWTVSRIADPSPEAVAWRFPDWTMVVEFPILTVEDVMKAAIGDDLLPPGITRFLVPGRALRLNVDLSLLRSARSQSEKQRLLDDLLAERAHDGRIRRYEETVYILDD